LRCSEVIAALQFDDSRGEKRFGDEPSSFCRPIST
jgi:hypothetical protein